MFNDLDHIPILEHTSTYEHEIVIVISTIEALTLPPKSDLDKVNSFVASGNLKESSQLRLDLAVNLEDISKELKEMQFCLVMMFMTGRVPSIQIFLDAAYTEFLFHQK